MAYRTKLFDVTGIMTSVHNTPYDFFSGPRIKLDVPIHASNWLYCSYDAVPFTGNGLATTLSYYKKCLKNDHHIPYYMVPDGHLIKTSSICTLPINGYHIGWNQEMDEYKKLSEHRFETKINEQQEVFCHSNNETRIFNLKDLVLCE